MEKHYLFKASSAFDRIAFEDILSDIGVEGVDYSSPTEGSFVADAKKVAELVPLLSVLRDDLGISISFLVSHDFGALEKKLLSEAFAYYPNQALFPTDVILKEMSFGNYSSYPLIKARFEGVPHELMLTAGTYLRCGLDGILAAKCLFVHRNTFLYRLNHREDESRYSGLSQRAFSRTIFPTGELVSRRFPLICAVCTR